MSGIRRQLIAMDMIQELNENYLHVILTPAPEPKFDGHMIRTVCNRNPHWYRGQNFRRKTVIKCLSALSDGRYIDCGTMDKLKDIIACRMESIDRMANTLEEIYLMTH